MLRWALFLYVLLLVCPIRFWPLAASIDNAWVYAINLAAARGVAGIVWTTGPLGYLVFPQDIGANLAHALVFQTIVWGALAAVFADLFFRAGFPLRNLAAFAALLGMSAPLYWFNYMGLDNLFVAAMLVLLTLAWQRGSRIRFVAALVIAGVIPLIKISGGVIAGGALAGYLLIGVIERRRSVVRDLALAISIPAAIAVVVAFFVSPSFSALVQYVRGSLQIAANYGTAMSEPGNDLLMTAAVETFVWIGVVWSIAHKAHPGAARFQSALLAIPLLVSFKHGFVRQDVHVISFFCFAFLAMALMVLHIPVRGKAMVPVLLALPAGIVWLQFAQHVFDVPAYQQASGTASMRLAYHALRRRDASEMLKSNVEHNFPQEARFEPEILSIVGQEPVATTKLMYSRAGVDRLNLKIYPVVQRYAAYTPYLDQLNAAWIRDQGPRYLISDWETIDNRQAWAETPAMWLEVYRWYDTRLTGERNLLLERRRSPRFERLKRQTHFEIRPSDGFTIPESDAPVFWSLDCGLTRPGKLRNSLFRIPEVLLHLDQRAGTRVIPEVLVSPVLGNFLPENLHELAALLTPGAAHKSPVQRIRLGGPGLEWYSSSCPAELWTPE